MGSLKMKITINPSYEEIRKKIEDIPTLFSECGTVIYDGRNILKRITIGEVDMVIKRFKKPHLINRIAYSYFRKSKAARSYIHSMMIQERGFIVPDPIALIEQYEVGLLSYSYYACRFDDGETVRELMEGDIDGKEEQLRAFAFYTAQLHQKGVLHIDYSPGNILIHEVSEKVDHLQKYSFSLVDVNRVRFPSDINCDMVCKNMRRLCISRGALSFIMAEYALVRGWCVKDTVNLAVDYSDKFFAKYMFRRAFRSEGNLDVITLISFRFSRFLRRRLPHSWKCRCLMEREKCIYQTYLRVYDYCKIYFHDYQ